MILNINEIKPYLRKNKPQLLSGQSAILKKLRWEFNSLLRRNKKIKPVNVNKILIKIKIKINNISLTEKQK